jgi:hypothetical protein
MVREDIAGGIKAFMESFTKGSIWPNQRKIKIKQWGEKAAYNSEFAQELGEAGFEREMQDLVIWR